MSGKRPLVWLSAENNNTAIQRRLAEHWGLIRFFPTEPAPLLEPATAEGAQVGVIDLSGASARNPKILEQWCEALALSHWVAIVASRPKPETAVARIIASYCSDFQTLPLDDQRFETVLGHLWGMAQCCRSIEPVTRNGYQSLVLEGDSSPIRQTRSLLRRFSTTLEPVLITGESGTGKEAAARFVHDHSCRAAGPLIIVNCAALPDTLTQSELFGYEKGAFTHALHARKGRLEQANGGSVIFYGIDELNLAQQAAILRFLQEGQIERIGAEGPITVNCRLISTSCQPLSGLVAAGRFRSDVYYRLGGLEVRLPTLRDRPDDIPTIASRLLARLQPDNSKKRLSREAAQSLLEYRWPGNFRELQNRLRQGLLLSDNGVITPKDLNLTGTAPDDATSGLSLQSFRARAERQALSCSLRLAGNNVSEAARILHISRVSLYRLLGKYHLVADGRPAAPTHPTQGDPP